MTSPVPEKSASSEISKRKRFRDSKRHLSVFCLIFASLGVILMMVEIEFVTLRHNKQSADFFYIGFAIKVSVSIFTGILLICLILYHKANIQLFMLDNNLYSWRHVLTIRWLFSIFIELVICAVHVPPIPGYDYIWITYRLVLGNPEKDNIPINVIITIIMFLRGYLIFRVMVLYSHIYNHSSSQRALLTKGQTIDSEFALKYLLTVYSKAFLIVSVGCVVFWTSWAVRVCEIYEEDSNLYFFNNVWFIAITFMTIGYGDIVPRSSCGRFIAVLSGVFGVMYTAYVVAIIAKTLQLTYSESYLHQFVIGSDLDKNIMNQAAQIVQNSWRIYKASKSHDLASACIIRWKLRLLNSKKSMKFLQSEKIQLETTSLRISTIFYSQNQIQQDISKLKHRINNINEMTKDITKYLEMKS